MEAIRLQRLPRFAAEINPPSKQQQQEQTSDVDEMPDSLLMADLLNAVQRLPETEHLAADCLREATLRQLIKLEGVDVSYTDGTIEEFFRSVSVLKNSQLSRLSRLILDYILTVDSDDILDRKELDHIQGCSVGY